LLASEAEYQFVRLGLRCVSIHDNIQLASQTKLLSSEDVVLVFSHTGRDRWTVPGLALARRAGALIVGITSEPDSPLAKRSDIALVLPETRAVDQATGLHSKVLELTLIEAIASCIAVSTGQEISVVTRCDELVAKALVC
jgi:RpiR family carbohydrate utilization transcriptional regulator